MEHQKSIIYADDDYEPISLLFRLRAPSLVVGLVLGIFISIVISRFEEVFLRDVQATFFIPFVVYIADAIGAQTHSIYARDLKSGHPKFSRYVRKELILGAVFGVLFSVIAGAAVFLWLGKDLLALSVAVATLLAVGLAPIVALMITQIIQSSGRDPAAGAGPIATVIQDMISVIIYGVVCSFILLN